MGARYMLDTNIVSDMLKNPQGISAARGAAHIPSAISVSVITACELRFGVAKKASEKLKQRVERFLSSFEILPFQPDASYHFAVIRNELERAGTPIGPFDLLIAAHARVLGLTLVTDNTREFSRVEGLKLENWLNGGETNG